MADSTRTKRIGKIRHWLDTPILQKPNPHLIFTQMLKDEHELNLELTNTRQPWNLFSLALSTVAGQSDYVISQPVAVNQRSGKVYSVVRSTGDDDLPYLPIPFGEYNQLEFGELSTDLNARLAVEEKINFYRKNVQDSTYIAVIQPTPQSVMTYLIHFHVGILDTDAATLSGIALMPELHDYLDLKTAIALLPYAFWQGYTLQENRDRRKELRESLMLQLADYRPKVDEYIDQINNPVASQMGYWNE